MGNSYIIVNGDEIYKFKANDFKINTALSCLGIVSKCFLVDNKKKTGLYRCVNFSVNYDSADVDVILDIQKYLIKKNAM